MSTPDPTREAKALSLRVAIERLFAIETLMRRGSPIATERTTPLEEIRAALAADAEEKREIVAVLNDCRAVVGFGTPLFSRLTALLAKLEGTVTT